LQTTYIVIHIYQTHTHTLTWYWHNDTTIYDIMYPCSERHTRNIIRIFRSLCRDDCIMYYVKYVQLFFVRGPLDITYDCRVVQLKRNIKQNKPNNGYVNWIKPNGRNLTDLAKSNFLEVPCKKWVSSIQKELLLKISF